MIGIASGVVVDHAHCFEHPRIADQFSKFISQVRAMQTGRDKDGDAIEGGFPPRPMVSIIGRRNRWWERGV